MSKEGPTRLQQHVFHRCKAAVVIQDIFILLRTGIAFLKAKQSCVVQRVSLSVIHLNHRTLKQTVCVCNLFETEIEIET